jgi:phosphoribosyl 1,2-cyclic phosphodiesterase
MLISRNIIAQDVSRARLVVLGSSSSGNATLVEVDGASVLVDAGFSCKELTRRMATMGADPKDLVAVLLTHEHVDHVRGVRVLARRHDLPVYGTPGTLRATGRFLQGVALNPTAYNEVIERDEFTVKLVPIPHDAAEPAAIRIDAGGRRFLVATDVGHFPWSLLEMGQDMDALVLESNHDERMLRDGPYPPFLKRRIRGPLGHLSNSESATALRVMLGPRTKGVLLGHLSQRNNTEDVALRTVLDGVPSDSREGVDIRTTSPSRSEEIVL